MTGVRDNPADPADNASRRTVFLHDFVPLWLDLQTATDAIPILLDGAIIRRAVVDAWNAEVASGVSAGLAASTCVPSDISVAVGPARTRSDAVILPLAWEATGDRWVAPLEADLEIAAFGNHRCHLHLMGRSQLDQHIEAYSSQASLHHRLTVAIVRHVLDEVAVHAFGQKIVGHPPGFLRP